MPEDLTGSDVLWAIDAVDELLHQARPVPLTDQVRVDKKTLSAKVERIGEALPLGVGRSSEADEFNALLDRLRALLDASRAIPLTAWHRIDREAAYDLIDQLRATIPAYVKEARLREPEGRGPL